MDEVNTDLLNKRADERRTARRLRKIQRKDRMPEPIFNEIFRTVPGTAIEVVPLHVDPRGNISVFMTKRSSKDNYWPGEWHCPGTMVLNKDETETETLEKPWERLKEREFMEQKTSEPVFVDKKLIDTHKRGVETALIHFVTVPGDLEGGKFYPVDNLPENTINHHKGMIKDAAMDLIGEYMQGRLNLPVKPKTPESWQGLPEKDAK